MAMMPVPPGRTLRDLRSLTPARVGLGRSGAGMPTDALLAFTLDHARARDAVHAPFDIAALMEGLGSSGLEPFAVRSRARDRKDYLRRPDLGRMLDEDSHRLLGAQGGGPCRLAIVIGDGLSPAAVNRHAVELVRHLIPSLVTPSLVAPSLAADAIGIDCAVVATGARVALGDEIGAIINARMLVMLIGERPGLSTPDSLGAYLTFAPRIGRTDAERNCISNIHGAGLGYEEAAARIAWLVREGLTRGITGVALKDESGGGTSQRLAAGSGQPDKTAV
jgi:ethanolamine ammonia-lyase small subunit